MLLLSAQENKAEPLPNAIAVYWKTLDKKEKEIEFIINKIKHAETILGKNSRIIFRASGTEHKLRIMGEASNKNLLSKTLKKLRIEIQNYING